MTGAEIKAFFYSLIDDTIDDDFANDLMSNAKDNIESERNWEFLKKEDSSKTTSAGDTYTTAKALPTDFKSAIALYIADDCRPYLQIPFEMKHKYKDSSRKFYINVASGQFFLCGTRAETKTINLFYVYNTADITDNTSPVFLSRFHKRIAFEMAALVEAGVDGDSLNFRMSEEHKLQAKLMKDSMHQYDQELKLRATENASDQFESSDGKLDWSDGYGNN